MESLRSRLIQCGWRDELKAYAKGTGGGGSGGSSGSGGGGGGGGYFRVYRRACVLMMG